MCSYDCLVNGHTILEHISYKSVSIDLAYHLVLESVLLAYMIKDRALVLTLYNIKQLHHE